MAQNYPEYRAVSGTWAPAGNIPLVYAQQGTLGAFGNVIAWSAAPPDPNNLAVVHGVTSIPGYVYVIGTSAGNYATYAAALAAAQLWCQTLASERDAAAAAAALASSVVDVTQAVGFIAANPLVVVGPL